MIAAAGRSRLLQLRRDLATARDGRALLDRKREAILRAIGDRLPRLEAMRRAAATAMAGARGQLADAQAQLGRTAVAAAALAQPLMPPITAAETRLAGVSLPELRLVQRPFVPRYGPAGASPALDRAGAAFAALVPELVALAAAEAGVRRLRRALARTVRRINALDSIVVPDVSREIHVVTSALEEDERDEAVRLERWRSKSSTCIRRSP